MRKKSILFLLLLFLAFLMPMQTQAAKISKKSLVLVPKQSYKLTIKGSKKKATWASSNPGVVAVSNKGKVFAGNSTGNAVIYASLAGKTYACNVAVVLPSISNTKEMKKGQSSYIGIGNKKAFSKITYKSSNKKIATVSSKGKVKAKAAGSCTVKVTFNKCYSVYVHVMVDSVNTSSIVNVMKGSGKHLTPSHSGNGTPFYSVANPALGYVVNGTYYSTGFGLNTVIYSSGNYKHTFMVRNYCWEAHRGYHAVYPENTLEAIRAAKEAGASAVEIDVRSTRDGRFVLAHDSSLSDITNGALPNKVHNYWLSTLQAQDYIYKNGKRYHIATLEEALDLASQLGLNVAIEMKTLPSISTYFTISKEELTRNLCNIIRGHGNAGTSIIVTSAENAGLLGLYSGGIVPVRATNDSYSSDAALRNVINNYAYMMSTTVYASRYYGGYIQTVDNPF